MLWLKLIIMFTTHTIKYFHSNLLHPIFTLSQSRPLSRIPPFMFFSAVHSFFLYMQEQQQRSERERVKNLTKSAPGNSMYWTERLNVYFLPSKMATPFVCSVSLSHLCWKSPFCNIFYSTSYQSVDIKDKCSL